MSNFALDAFLKDSNRIEYLKSRANDLRAQGIPFALIELGSITAATYSEKPEQRNAYLEGYVSALRDLFFFEERHIGSSNEPPPAPTFGAIKRLEESGEISKAEADKLRREKGFGHGRSDT